MDLQRSCYFKIAVGQTDNHNLPIFSQRDTLNAPANGQVFFNFCLPWKINAQNQKQVIFKGQFGLKLASLKSNLVFLKTISKLEEWIESNIKALHKKFYGAYFKSHDDNDQ